MIAAGGSIKDPFELGRSLSATVINSDVSVKTIRNPRLDAGETTEVLLCVGQSNIANTVNATYSVINAAKVDNLNVVDGGVYAASDPMVGCSSMGPAATNGSWLGRLADKRIAEGADRVILVPIARGGSIVADWATGPLAKNLNAAIARCEAHKYTITAMLWQQGENDQIAGTSQSNYYNSLLQMIANSRAAGAFAPWLIGKSSYVYGSVSTAVQAACEAAINGVDVFAGANCDALNSTYRFDNLHFNATGAEEVATRWNNALLAAL